MSELYDVLVVGAGPVGSYLAGKLARLGHKVIVFEQQAKAGEAVCCTGIVGRECFDRFPIPEAVVYHRASSAKFFSPSGKCLRLCKETAQAYILDRPAFDRALARKAQESGADCLFSARVNNISLMDHRVRGDVEYKGRRDNFEGRVAILSNGFGASLPRKLGGIADFVFGAQAEVYTKGVDEVEVYFGQEVAPGFFTWLVPTSSGKALAGLLSRRKPGVYLNNFLSTLHAQGKIASAEAKITCGALPLTPLPKTYGERIIIVGDAAGQVKPTTGGGIYYGLLCADIAADVVHEALCADDLSAKRLERYEKDWKKKLSRELQVGYWARKLYEKLSDREIERVFSLATVNNIHEVLLRSPDFSFDWHSGSIINALKHKPLRQAVWSMARSFLPSF